MARVQYHCISKWVDVKSVKLNSNNYHGPPWDFGKTFLESLGEGSLITNSLDSLDLCQFLFKYMHHRRKIKLFPTLETM